MENKIEVSDHPYGDLEAENAEQKLEAILDALAESVLELSDEEFITECEENGEDVEVIAEEVRRAVLEAAGHHVDIPATAAWARSRMHKF